MKTVVRFLVFIALFALIMGHPSHDMGLFRNETTYQWVDAICGPTNTTCRNSAFSCFDRASMARSFLERLEVGFSGEFSFSHMVQQCQKKQDRLNLCATEANLNATWSSIYGEMVSCENLFRGRPFGQRHIRSPLPPRGFPFKDMSNSERSHRHHTSQRITTFLDTLETTNPGALLNYRTCMLREEGLVSANGSVVRKEFSAWATAAFARHRNVSDAVVAAIEDTCPEPEDPMLADYMQCWGATCVQALLSENL